MQWRTDNFRLTASGVVFGVLAMAAAAWADPTGEQVASGTATFDRSGAETVITASNNAIINYQSFNIGAGEAVRFIQPDATSRVLNRVLDGNITQINGSLTSNGQVYIANPAGVFFGGQAVVNVGSLTAAAGTITDQAFLSGIDHFTNLTGQVVNQGTIEGNAITLIGQQVANYGSIVAPNGMVTMVAGDDVYLAQGQSPVIIRVQSESQKTTGAAVLQEGTVDAGENGAAMFGAADVYALAIHHGGTTKAGTITVSAPAAQVQVTGTLDASRTAPGSVGGDVKVLGNDVILGYNAKVDASGPAGGGTIKIGGDFQGGGDLPTAHRTWIGSDVELRADATDHGDGGRIIVWSEAATAFYGVLYAQGGPNGGNGGFAEISGGSLVAPGRLHLGAVAGSGGNVLYDPENIVIHGGTADGSDANFSGTLIGAPSATNSSTLVDHYVYNTGTGNYDYDVGYLDYDTGVSDPFVVYESELEGSPLGYGITLEAKTSITVTGTFTDGDLKPAGYLYLVTRNDANDGVIDLTGSTDGYNLLIKPLATGPSGDGSITIYGSESNTHTCDIYLPSLETINDDIWVATENGSIYAYGTITTGGNTNTVTLAATGDVYLYNTVTTKQGEIDLMATGSVTLGQYDPDPLTTGDETAGKLVSTSGPIYIAADYDTDGVGGVTMHADSSVNAGSGDVQIAAGEDILLSSVKTTSSNAVVVQSTNGSILDNNGDTVNIDAKKVSLSAAQNIGTITDMASGDGDAIELTNLVASGITTLTTTNSGSQINLDIGSSALTVFATPIDVAGTNAGSAIIRSDGDIDASSGFTNYFDYDATDSIGLFSGGTLKIPISVTGKRFWFRGDTDITNAADAHTFTITADQLDFESGGSTATTLNTTVDTLTALLGAATLTINETDAIDLSDVAATGDIVVNAHGDVGAGVINATSAHNVTIATDTGSVYDIANTITADVLTITAPDGIDVTTNVNSANLHVTSAGDITVDETNAITLTDVDTANGSIAVTAGGTITATDVQSLTDADANDISLTANSGGNIIADLVNAGTAGDVTLQAGGNIDMTSSGSTGVVADQLTATSSTGINLNTTINALTASTTWIGDITINETDGLTLTDVRSHDGSISVVANNGSINALLVHSNTDADANDIYLEAHSGNLTYGDINAGTRGDVTFDIYFGNIIDNGQIVADQLTVDVDGAADLDTSVNSIDAISHIVGDIVIHEANAVTLNDIETADGHVTVTAGGAITATNIDTHATDDGTNDITLTTTSGNILLGTLTAGSLNDVSLTSAGSILDNNGAADNIIAHDLSMSAVNNIGSITDFMAATGDAIELNLTGSLNSATITAAGGAIYLDFGSSLPTIPGGAIVPASGAAAYVILEASGDLNVGTASSAVTTSAGDSLGFIAGHDLIIPNSGLSISGSGAQLLLRGINDVYTDTLSRTLTLSGPSVSIISGSAGGNTTLATTVDNLYAHLTGSADLAINSTGAINLASIVTDDGSITATAGGDMTATSVDSSAVDDDANDIALTTTAGGNVYVGTINAGSLNDVTINSAGSVSDLANTITADVLTINAVSGINVHTAVNTANLHVTAAGDLIVHETDDITLANLDTFDGDIAVTAGGAITATDVESATNGAAASGDITLNSGGAMTLTSVRSDTVGDISATAGGDMTVVHVSAASGASNASLSSSTAIDGTTDGTPDVLADRIDLSAPQIGQTTPVQVAALSSMNATGTNITLANDFVPMLVGQIHATNQIVISGTQSIDSVTNDYTPDLWAKTILLTASSIGDSSSVDVLATQQFCADTSASNGNITVDFLAGWPPVLCLNPGSGTVTINLELVTNIGDGLPRFVQTSEPTVNELVSYLPDLPPSDESVDANNPAPQQQPADANDSSADNLNNTTAPLARVEHLPQLADMTPAQFKAKLQGAYTSYAATWPPSLIEPHPFSVSGFVNHLRQLALGTDAATAADAVTTLSGLNELARNIHLNGLDDARHADQRQAALQPYLIEGLTAAQMDELVMYLLNDALSQTSN